MLSHQPRKPRAIFISSVFAATDLVNGTIPAFVAQGLPLVMFIAVGDDEHALADPARKLRFVQEAKAAGFIPVNCVSPDFMSGGAGPQSVAAFADPAQPDDKAVGD